jgi:hypothetical protein
VHLAVQKNGLSKSDEGFMALIVFFWTLVLSTPPYGLFRMKKVRYGIFIATFIESKQKGKLYFLWPIHSKLLLIIYILGKVMENAPRAL